VRAEDGTIEVVFIAGAGRTGSTLLDRMLGQVTGFHSGGELRHVWGRGFLANQLCGCGERFRTCPFWAAVAGEAFGGFDGVDAGAARARQRRLDHLWHIPHIVSPVRAPQFEGELARYLDDLRRLYRGLHLVTGGATIVDSSKAASHAFLLRAIPGLRVSAVHLVRDSRAVAFSWSRHRVRPEVHWREVEMPRPAPWRVAGEWNAMNAAAEALGRSGPTVRPLRYEDLAGEPRRRLGELLRGLGHDGPDLGFLEDGRMLASPAHTVSGNPQRFGEGRIDIREDSEWKHRMPAGDRAVVTALTWPLLLRYGYELGSGGGSGADGAVARGRAGNR
jgi:hypothetical protein